MRIFLNSIVRPIESEAMQFTMLVVLGQLISISTVFLSCIEPKVQPKVAILSSGPWHMAPWPGTAA